MKTWTRIVGAALTLALYNGCTVTVGSGNDDTDDVDFSSKTEEPETTDDESTSEETTTKPDKTSDEETSSATSDDTTSEPSDTSSTNESTSAPASSSSDQSTSSEPDTSEPPAGACPAEPEAGSCDECVVDSCADDWAACCADDYCYITWTAIYSCVVNNATDDFWNDFDQCAAGASETGDELDLPATVQNLYSCVNAPYMSDGGEDKWARLDGDGTCSLACYNIANIDQ